MLNVDARKRDILRAVVTTYVHDAEPVGSERIAQQFHARISPATIRNEMADLEEMGYLSHPYTSAGRVPTDRGYRCYVDTLLREEQVTPRERLRLQEALLRREGEEDLAQGLARTLAAITEYTSMVAPPPAEQIVVGHLHLVVIVKGAANILRQPEFQDARVAQPVLSALERDEVLADLLHDVARHDISVTIGTEHRYEELRGTSVVAAPYRARTATGAVGLVGPTRMKYAKVISLVRYLASTLSALGESS